MVRRRLGMPQASPQPTWHLITCEFAPRVGGVADFTQIIADVLSPEFPVHVWAPSPAVGAGESVVVHALESGFAATSLIALDRRLEACRPPRRLFVNWVPHGYGYKSLNVPFCLWLGRRARRGDEMAAAVHRLMLRVLLGAATRVWVSTSSFSDDVRRFAPRPIRPVWLPVASPIGRVEAAGDATTLRSRLAGDAPIVGHFGTCHALVAPLLTDILGGLSAARPDVHFILVGRNTEAFTESLIAGGVVKRHRILRFGEQNTGDLSLLLQCCDVFVQPYHDGVSARRTTLMALLQHGSAIVTAHGHRTEALWLAGRAIHLLPRAEPDLFVSAVLELLRNPAEREELGRQARAVYLNHFDVRHIHTALLGAAPL
jgi:glycosyltransferase involved in cell wall biosynthesis